jgi:HD-like signal output (HDOD) protein/CheY-like chemotaxis protein
MKRVLFVDDEALVLEGLRDALRPHRHEYQMVFVTSGDAAVAELGQARFDVVVSDMRMPRMDGAAVLAHVQRLQPQAARLILSGYADEAASRQAAAVAHQYLAKPCDPATLASAIRRTLKLHGLVDNERYREAIGGITQLPPTPRAFSRLARALCEPGARAEDLAAMLSQDPALTAKAMQLANSGFFAAGREAKSVEAAVAILGTATLKTLFLSTGVFGGPVGAQAPPVPLSRHAWVASGIARHVAAESGSGEGRGEDLAAVAGLLHDVGLQAMAARLPDEWAAIQECLAHAPRPLHEVEAELLGTTHAELGAYLLGLWGVPEAIVEAVALHHRPCASAERTFGPLAAVHVADSLAHEAQCPDCPHAATPALDRTYLEAIGAWQRVDAWRVAARDITRAA